MPRAAPNRTPPPEKRALRLWLRLLGTTTLIEKRLRARFVDQYAATLPRFDVMSALSRAPQEGLAMGELSAMLRVSNGNVTGIIDRLIQDGLVERRSAPLDRRSIRVLLTPAGRRSFEIMAEAHEAWVEDIFADLTAEEIDACMAALSSLRKRLGSQT